MRLATTVAPACFPSLARFMHPSCCTALPDSFATTCATSHGTTYPPCYLLPATRYLLPATCYPLPATRYPLPDCGSHRCHPPTAVSPCSLLHHHLQLYTPPSSRAWVPQRRPHTPTTARRARHMHRPALLRALHPPQLCQAAEGHATWIVLAPPRAC
jgi:hypothetical protein